MLFVLQAVLFVDIILRNLHCVFQLLANTNIVVVLSIFICVAPGKLNHFPINPV